MDVFVTICPFFRQNVTNHPDFCLYSIAEMNKNDTCGNCKLPAIIYLRIDTVAFNMMLPLLGKKMMVRHKILPSHN